MRTMLIHIVSIIATLPSMAQWITLETGTLDEFDAVLIDDAQHYWIGGIDGILWRTSDGGVTWAMHDPAGAGDVEKIIRLDATTLLAAADDGMVARSSDNGQTWSLIATGAPEVLYDLTHVDGLVWASGRDGGIVHSNDHGLTWTLQNSGTTERLHGIYALDANTVICVGREGVLLRTTDGGATWQQNIIAGGDDLRAVIFLSDPQRTGLIAGPAGSILRSTDLGITWTGVSTGTQLEAQALASEDPSMVLAVGDEALILKSTDQGQSWESMSTTAFSELSGVDVRDGVAVAVGANGTVLKLGSGEGQGMNDQVDAGKFKIYPNPTIGPVTIELEQALEPSGDMIIELWLADGRLVDREPWRRGKKMAHIEWLDPGNYIIRAIGPDGTSTQQGLVVLGE